MNKDIFQGHFNELKGKIKEQWGKLTDDEISQINGKWDQFLGKIQAKYGWTKERAETEINNWFTNAARQFRSSSEAPSYEKQHASTGSFQKSGSQPNKNPNPGHYNQPREGSSQPGQVNKGNKNPNPSFDRPNREGSSDRPNRDFDTRKPR